MPEFLSKWMTAEAIKHPAMLFLMIIIGAGSAGFILNPFVMAEDYEQFQSATQQELSSLRETTQQELKELKGKMQRIDRAVCEVKYSGDVNALEQSIASAESEIFDLQRRENASNATALDLERLDKQRTRLGKLQRQLSELRRRGCQ